MNDVKITRNFIKNIKYKNIIYILEIITLICHKVKFYISVEAYSNTCNKRLQKIIL